MPKEDEEFRNLVASAFAIMRENTTTLFDIKDRLDEMRHECRITRYEVLYKYLFNDQDKVDSINQAFDEIEFDLDRKYDRLTSLFKIMKKSYSISKDWGSMWWQEGLTYGDIKYIMSGEIK
jgi:hypothetical protein